MNTVNHSTLTQMTNISTLRNFIYKYENDTRISIDVIEQLRDELEVMESNLFSKLESDLAGQVAEQVKREQLDWYKSQSSFEGL